MSVVAVKLCKNKLHEMTPENTRINRHGHRTCLACRREADRRRHLRDRPKRNANSRADYQRNRERYRENRLRSTFGMTIADYEAMLAAQDGRCAICGTTDPGGRWGTRFAIDHCHETNRVRGLLCGRCNVMLGNAKDEPARLRAAADYLERAE